jgi:hypothetical protein
MNASCDDRVRTLAFPLSEIMGQPERSRDFEKLISNTSRKQAQASGDLTSFGVSKKSNFFDFLAIILETCHIKEPPYTSALLAPSILSTLLLFAVLPSAPSPSKNYISSSSSLPPSAAAYFFQVALHPLLTFVSDPSCCFSLTHC